MFESIFLGAIQGITEWLPVSSEGVTAFVIASFSDRHFPEAVAYALWLHVGTALSASVAFRGEIFGLFSDLMTASRQRSNLFIFLVIASVVSGVVGIPILIVLESLSSYIGISAMAAVGILMLITGGVQLRKPIAGVRAINDVSSADAVLVGFVQGLCILPGLSRSGLTIAVLLVRQIDRRDALVISFLMSIPASIGAGIYILVTEGIVIGGEQMLGALVAFLVGLATIKILLRFSERVSFGLFMALVGIFIVSGAIWQATFT